MHYLFSGSRLHSLRLKISRWEPLQTINRYILNTIVLATIMTSAVGQTVAAFAGADATTQGSWKGKYGSDGYLVIGESTKLPGYLPPFGPKGALDYSWVSSTYGWAASTTDIRALQKSTATDRIAAAWYSEAFSLDLPFSDHATHLVAVYCLDWDHVGRAQTVDVLDANTGAILNTQSLTSFGAGTYLVWNLSGHVRLRFSQTAAGLNAVVSGIFFGGATAPTCSVTKIPNGLPAFTVLCKGAADNNSTLYYANTDGSQTTQIYGIDGLVCLAYINGKSVPWTVPLPSPITVQAASAVFQCSGSTGTPTQSVITWP